MGQNYQSKAFLWHLLCGPLGFGPARLPRLLRCFGSPEGALAASAEELERAGFDREVAQRATLGKEYLDVTSETQELERLGIALVALGEPGYPKLLSEIPQPPVLLYCRGRLVCDELCLAVVGTRKATGYGRAATAHLVTPLVRAGITVVSGLAFGIDAAAHRLAVQLGRRTVTVVGSGPDEPSIYPREHVHLSEQIIETGGLILSEYPPGTPALKHHFVARNRIIAGLSVGVLVVEADQASGALITARHALDQNRAVYAVPGPIYSETSRGPNELIRQGAVPATDSSDILEDLRIQPTTSNAEAEAVSELESRILERLTSEPLKTDELIKLLGTPAGELTATLTMLEVRGFVSSSGGVWGRTPKAATITP